MVKASPQASLDREAFMSRSVLASIVAAATLVAAGSAHASVLIYDVLFSGPNESPANASPGVGIGLVTIDTVANTMHLQATFSGLVGTTTASHIHCCTALPGTGTAGVATTTPTFAGFPLGVTSGSYDNTLDLTLASSYNPSFVTANGGTTAGAEAFLLAGIASGDAYWNIHTSSFPTGEIRGFLKAAIPEPASWGLLIGGFALVGLALRRRPSVLA
ncbi:MAG: CHRD domain-containing protein [Caulobacteraceae bacterium]